MSDECYVFPLLAEGVSIKLGGNKYPLYLGLSLHRLDSMNKERLASAGIPHDPDLLFSDWAVVVPMPERNTQFEEQGVSRFSAAELLADGMLATLRVLLCGGADSPQPFRGRTAENDLLIASIEEEGWEDEWERDIDDPPVGVCDDARLLLGTGTSRKAEFSLKDEHVEALYTVWRGVVRLRGLNDLPGAFSEQSFRRLDHRIPKGRPEGKYMSPKEYRGLFQHTWRKHLERKQNRSRLGRALQLFEVVMMMPGPRLWQQPGLELAEFLQMFLVLETMFGYGAGKIGEQLAVATSKLLAGRYGDNRGIRDGNLGDESQIYDRVRELYTLRNDIVHGNRQEGFDCLPEEDRTDPKQLASRSLACVLGNLDSDWFRALTGDDEAAVEFLRKLG